MAWLVLLHLVGLVVDLVSGAHGRADEQDLQIAVLRHQGRLPRWEKLTLTALTARLVRRKWTYRRPPARGRPPVATELEA